MRKFLFGIALVLMVSAVVAQETPSEVLTASVKKKRKPPRKEMLLVNLNFDSWIGQPSTISPKWFSSRGVDIAALYDQVIAKSNFSAALGVGFNSHNIHMEAFPIEYSVLKDPSDPSSVTTFTLLDPRFFDGKKISVNKLSTNFIDIPVEVRFRSNPRKNGKRFAVSVGFKLGWLVQSHTKTKVDEDFLHQGVNFRQKVKTYDIPNLTKFRYGLTARIGYANVYVNFFYSLTPLFINGRGTEATPISIGIGYTPF